MVSNTNRLFINSNKLYDRAIKTIPLASQTFSKSAMNFPKGASPLFFKKGQVKGLILFSIHTI